MSAPGGYRELSPGQRQLWFLHRLDPDSAAYNIGAAFDLTGPLDAGALHRAFDAVVARHPGLRSVVTEQDGHPRQTVRDDVRASMAVDDLRALSADEQRSAVTRLSQLEVVAPFDLSVAPLIRLRLLRLGARASRLLVTVHHIAADGRAGQVLHTDLFRAYQAFADGREPDRQPVDVVVPGWPEPDPTSDLAYWRDALRDLPQELGVVTDLPRPVTPTPRGVLANVRLDDVLSARLRDLARREQATLFCVLLAAWQTLLGRLSGRTDVAVGTPVTLRPEEHEDVVAMMVNNVVLRGDLSSSPSFARLVAQARDRLFDALEHRALPFDTMVETVAPRRQRGRNPLFQSQITLGRATATVEWAQGARDPLRVAPVALDAETVKFDLSLAVVEETDGTLRVSVGAAADLFLPRTAQRVASYLHTLLANAVDDPGAPASRLELTAPDDPVAHGARQGDDVRYPFVTPAQRLAEWAAAAPDAVAVRDDTGGRVSYRQFTVRVNQLAHRLRRAGVGADTVVGVCLPRGVDLLVAVHAIAAAGGAYLPLEPELPDRRLGLMARDARARLIVTVSDGGHGAGTFPGLPILAVDRERASLESEPDTPVDPQAHPDALAYVIFTSGSTGTPKGVGISYRSLVNRVAWMQQYHPLSCADRVLHKTPFGFDVSVWELFWPFTAGAGVVVADPGGHRDPGYLAALMAREAATVVHFVPSVLDVFLDELTAGSLPRLRLLFSSGEALGGDVAARTRELLPHAGLHNLYGPTEAAVDVTAHPVADADRAVPVPIGRPVPNTRVEVLGPELQRCPVGVPGELFLGGVQLARGYVSRPGLTAERFVPDPYGPPGSRLYRTGDLVCLREDGALDYRGRLDAQVKVNGLRIEPGEIEAALLAEPEVRAAAVTAVDDGSGTRLVGYLVPSSPDGQGVFGTRGWADRLRRRIPASLVPGQFVTVDSLPLSRNGKLDRAALPAPPRRRPDTATTPLAPGAEAAVASVWRTTLGLARVGPKDNFFAIGGDSMRSLRVVSRLRAAGYALTLEDLFTHPTPRTLAALLEEPSRAGKREPGRAERPAAVPAVGAFGLLPDADRARLVATRATREELR